MMEKINNILRQAVTDCFGVESEAVFVRTDEKNGDFTSNIAMQLAGKLGKNPREIAEEIAGKLSIGESIASSEVAGPGFINIKLKDFEIYRSMFWEKPKYEQNVLLEYSCPNAFKELHTGHLYQTLIGDSMGRIYEFCGAKVVRTSFGGDVGLHAAKCLWGILSKLGSENAQLLDGVEHRAQWISEAYVAGSAQYEADDAVKNEINQLNKKIYGLYETGDRESEFAKIYFTTRQWCYDYFDQFYESINAKPFDRYFPESETMEPGLQMVKANLGAVFSESDGAVVLDEARSGLHTRVFITSAGLPTYETKDLGVIQLEAESFDYDYRVIMTGNDQSEYMKVVFAALSLIDPELGKKQNHVANGTVRFGDGTKMSSRLGNVSRATDVVETVVESVAGDSVDQKTQVGLGAIKYSLLKNRVGGDIAFDLEQSISTEGNSGPYLQYALVRARSILRKTGATKEINEPQELELYERRLAVKLSEMPEVLRLAITDFSPHHICTYLYDLAGVFNQFYENSRVMDDPRADLRVVLVDHYEKTLALGLDLLGIPQPEEM